MEDIAPQLLESIQNEFNKQYLASNKIQKLEKLIDAGKASYQDAHEYAVEFGNIQSQVYKKCIQSSSLPNGRMYYNIGKKVLNPTLSDLYNRIAEESAKVEIVLNENANIGLEAVRPDVNQSRIDGLIQKCADAEAYDDVSWCLDDPVINFAQSAVDDTIRANADFHFKAGLDPVIKRIPEYGACQWCQDIAGIYRYPKDTPHDVFRRHENCRCMVLYDPKDGKHRVQDAHTKRWIIGDDEKTNMLDFSVEKTDNMSKTRKALLANNVEINKPKKLNEPLTEDEIIKKIAGGDKTKGSCSSAAFAYIANKGGLDVRDFRGGDSLEIFSLNEYIKDIANLKGVKSTIINGHNDFKSAEELLKKINPGKEYYFAVGRHAAMVRKENGILQYLELQSPETPKTGPNGWINFVDENEKNELIKKYGITEKRAYDVLMDEKLLNRFKCQKTVKVLGKTADVDRFLIEADTLKSNDEFINLISFINTNIEKQMKGVDGDVL